MTFITAYNVFPHNINISTSKSFATATNTPISSVPHPLKSSIPDLASNIPIKHSHRSICRPVQVFEPVAVNVNSVSVPVCHRFHVAESVFCHQHVSSLAKLIFLTADTVTDTLNVCNVVKYVSSTNNTGKVFPSNHNPIVSLDMFLAWKIIILRTLIYH